MTAQCTQCRTTDPERLYTSGSMKKCKDCQRFYNVSVNAKRQRTFARTPALGFTHDQFLTWSREREPVCAYCGIREAELKQLQLRSQIDRGIEALGIDRVSNDGDYEIDNIVFCCFACNKVKGNVFTHDEMIRFLGPGVREAWRARLSGTSGVRAARI